MRKKLLASGCSFTDNWWTEKHDIPVWPEKLAENLEMPCINLGKRGLGNDYILNSVVDKLITHRDQIGLVVVMWSNFTRIDFEVEEDADIYSGLPWTSVMNSSKTPQENVRAPLSSFMKDNNINGTMIYRKPFEIKHLVKKSLRTFYVFQELMLSMKMPYIQLVGTQPLPPSIYTAASGFLINSPYMDKIDKSKFLGFPIFKPIGGWCVDDILDNFDNVRISEKDYHPNRRGHEIITEKLLTTIYRNSVE